MGKRSDFERNERDFYRTPLNTVYPLLPFIKGMSFYEPCAGDSDLTNHLCGLGLDCTGESDIEPQNKRMSKKDALLLYPNDINKANLIITNPPWDRTLLHPMIDRFRQIKPTWLLFDADWMHTRQSSDYMKFCSRIISVGRVRWIPGSSFVGKDNCCWYEFQNKETETRFVGR
jgi:hypothetical protein